MLRFCGSLLGVFVFKKEATYYERTKVISYYERCPKI